MCPGAQRVDLERDLSGSAADRDPGLLGLADLAHEERQELPLSSATTSRTALFGRLSNSALTVWKKQPPLKTSPRK